MKTYILTLKQKSGLLTELQSDTIYGHFCWRLKESLGDKALTDFLDFYRNNNPIFLLSDGILKVKDEIRFPRPYLFPSLVDKQNELENKPKKYEKIFNFVENKRNKERSYITLEEINSFLVSGKVEILEEEELNSDKKHRRKLKSKKPVEEALRVSVQIDRNTFGSVEGRLFSYNPTYTRNDVSYLVFIKVFDEELFEKNYKEILFNVFNIGFGKKKSSGFGQFEFIYEKDFNEFNNFTEPENANSFLVLGNYLPSQADSVTPLGYEFNTKYGKFGEELSLSENPFKNPIVFLTAGSCFKTTNVKPFYGRITNENEISSVNGFAVQFGMPFTINFYQK